MQYFSENPEDFGKAAVAGFEADLAWWDVAVSPQFLEKIQPFLRTGIDGEREFLIFGLSSTEYPFGLWCQIQGNVAGERLTYLQITLKRRAKDPPPSTLLAISKEIGGYPAGILPYLNLLRFAPARCDADVTLLFSESPLKFKSAHDSSDVTPFKVVDESVSIRDDATGTWADITFAGSGVHVNVGAEFDLALDESCFEIAAATLRERLNPLLKNP